MRIFRLTISVLFLLISDFCNGQESIAKLPEAELFTIENGLSQTRVNVSFSDSYGFLWVGTSGGLNRFDGYNFEIFKHVPYDSTSLTQNFIRCIVEDKNSNLWIGTNYGLNFYDRQTGKFRQYNHNPADSTTISHYRILSLYADNKGFIWINTEKYLDRLDPKTNTVIHYKRLLKSLNNNPINQNCPIVEGNNGLLWIGSNDGLFAFDPEKAEFVNYTSKSDDPKSLSDNEILTIYQTLSGNLWIGTKNGLCLFDPSSNNFKRYLYSKPEVTNYYFDAINAIVEDPKGKLWLGSDKGIIMFDPVTSSGEYQTNLLINRSLNLIGPIKSLLVDNAGIIWMSGFEGLFKIDTKPKKFELYNSSFNSFPFLSGDIISCIFKESDDLIWVGILDNGLNILNRKTGEVVRYHAQNPDPSKRISSNLVRCLMKDHTGTIWLGSINGLDIFNPDTRSFVSVAEKFPTVPNMILDNCRIVCMIEDNKGDIWIGTDRGLLRFQKNFKQITTYNKIYRDKTIAGMGIVYSLACDKDNKIWIGTENGLNCYDPDKDLFYRYEETGKKNDLSSRIIYSLLFDSRNTLWAGTASGLNKYNPDNQNFDVYTEASGLSNDIINGILEDDNYCLWLSTNKGISRYDILKNEFINFDITEGLQSYEFIHAAAFKATDGEMFFGGISGFNSFYPQKLPLNPHSPEIAITSFEIIDNKGITLYYSGGEDKMMRVKNNQSFRVKFAALDFTLPSSNHFEYSMQFKSKKDHWVPIGNQNSVTFSNLPPGEYNLRIRGSNNDHVWNMEGTSITVYSLAPFWMTKLAIYSYILISVLLIYLYIQYRTKSLRKSNKILRDRDVAAKEISRQKDLLSLRNKNIEDSINYARRIQKAMLTTPKQFRTVLPESFILHKPKDIVSGDFYWISEQGGKIFVAAADCTGHGVPGAFMSLISFELFRKIIKTEKIYTPASILNAMNENFAEIFGNVEDVVIRDGMDLSFCVFEKSMEKLEYSGAFNPLYIVRDNSLIELKADHFSIGADIGSDSPPKVFTNHNVLLQSGDMIYMFSDGYADQFGGPEGKKYKYRRFRHLLLVIHKLPLDKQRTIIEDNIESWRGDGEQVDDILIIGIRVGTTLD
jgi:ligand-binding sensor domain-containing protein/serine phosphatase RsbU (regulator of sigma subunit)